MRSPRPRELCMFCEAGASGVVGNRPAIGGGGGGFEERRDRGQLLCGPLRFVGIFCSQNLENPNLLSPVKSAHRSCTCVSERMP
jgi:hypothetical protein